jgi:putative addiction module component (TIGR02574 family)
VAGVTLERENRGSLAVKKTKSLYGAGEVVSGLARPFENRNLSGMSTVTEIESALEKLPVEAQREVAAWLDSRLAPAAFDPDVEEVWADEVKRRLEDLDSGRVQGVPAEQVFARARRILGR